MAENPAPTQSWCAHYPLALPINQQQSKQNVALQYRARSPSPQIISMGYAAHPCANCRRSAKASSNEKLSFSDVVLVESETPEVFIDKVVDLICTLGPPGSHYVDSIGGNPYEPRPKKRIAKKIAKDYDNLVSIINVLILRRNQRQ